MARSRNQLAILVLIVAIERRPIGRGAPGNVADGNGIKAAFGSQFEERLLQQLVCAPDAGIDLLVRHFALSVAYATFGRDYILITHRVWATLNATVYLSYNEMLHSASTKSSGCTPELAAYVEGKQCQKPR
jgi:hypothetical protein